jgi:long-chain acyl-CoA synthetase
LSERLLLRDRLRVISWRPMAHIAERLVTHYLALSHGWDVTTCADGRRVATLLPQVRPEMFFSPPRLWEKLRNSSLTRFDGDLHQAIANRQSMLADLGLDEVEAAIVGAAPCPAEVVQFWHCLGVPLGEVYGASETTGVATVNPPTAIRVGTAGTALPGVEVEPRTAARSSCADPS